RGAARARPAGGLRVVQRRRRPPYPRGRGRTQLGSRGVSARRHLREGRGLMATEAAVAEDRAHGTLRRELRFWEAIALSIGIMAPTAAMALNGVAPAGLVGRAVPLAFLFAAIAIGLISYSFVRLTRYFSHAGSTYALAGATLGPRAGFFAGWLLLATYSAFIAANIAEIGLFGTAFLDGAGIWSSPEWIGLSLIAAALVWVLAYGDVRFVTRALLSF